MDEPVYGQCTACGAIETQLNNVTHYKDYSSIGEHHKYPCGYGCVLCN